MAGQEKVSGDDVVFKSIDISNAGHKLAINSSATMLGVPSGSGVLFINLLNCEIESEISVGHAVLGLAWSKNGIACFGEGTLTLWSKELDKSVFQCSDFAEGIQDAVISHSGTNFYAITEMGSVNILKLPEIKVDELLLFPETLKTSALPLAISDAPVVEEEPKKKKQRSLDDLMKAAEDVEEKKTKKKKVSYDMQDSPASSEKNDYDEIFEPAITSSNNIREDISLYRGPNHSEWRNDARWLGYNALGKVVNRRIGASENIDIEFHDTRSHRPVRFVDDLGLQHCAFDTFGALFGGGRYIKYLPFPNYGVAWTSRSSWLLELEMGEVVRSVAVREDKLLVLTSKGFVRAITSTGIQLQPLLAPHGAFSLAMNDTGILMACVKPGGLFETVLFDLDFNLLAVYAFAPKDFFWLGTDESGCTFGAMDREYNFYLLESNGWKPVYVHEPRDKVPWPVSFTSEGIKALMSTSVPDPLALMASIVELVPFKVPLASASDPVYQLNASYLTLKNGLAHTDKKKATAADKLLLELFQMSVKSEMLERAYQVATMLSSGKSLDIAIQYAKHSRITALVEQLEKLNTTNNNSNALKTTTSFAAEIPMSQMSTQLPPSDTYPTSTYAPPSYSGMPNTIESSGYDFSQLLSRQEAAKENLASSEFFSSQPKKDPASINPFLSPANNSSAAPETQSASGDYLSAINMLNTTSSTKKK